MDCRIETRPSWRFWQLPQGVKSKSRFLSRCVTLPRVYHVAVMETTAVGQACNALQAPLADAWPRVTHDGPLKPLQRRHTDPITRTPLPRPSLRQVLRDEAEAPFSLLQFRHRVAQEHTLEALDFYLDVERLLALPVCAPVLQAQKQAALIARFIAEASPQCINIDARLRRRLEEAPTPELFREAQREMYRLLEENTFARFLKTAGQ